MFTNNARWKLGGARGRLSAVALAALWLSLVIGISASSAQQPARPKNIPLEEEFGSPSAQTQAKLNGLMAERLEAEALLELDSLRSTIFRTRRPVTRISVTHPDVVTFVQFSPTEFELIGGATGVTTLTIWFGEPPDQVRTIRYVVRVRRGDETEEEVEIEYGILEDRINELFPNSMIQLIPFADKLIVRGQARDAAEATQIMTALGAQSVDQTGDILGPQNQGFGGGRGLGLGLGAAAKPLGAEDLPTQQLISLLQVAGEQQVMLKVRIASLSRSALREMGTNLEIMRGDFNLSSSLGIAGAFSAVLDTTDLRLAIQATSSNGYSKLLAEPNLVTLNGQPAFFTAGGEFAVPTAVGVGGVGAVTSSFKSFGTQLNFTPTITDKDCIRLQVSPTISSVNTSLTNSQSGVPGLNTVTASTTVDLREGEWLALAGLLQDEQQGAKNRTPLLGDIPILDMIFSKKEVSREESELVILVSPEIIHPLGPKEAPLILPGMEVTEPGDWDLFIMGRYEGRPYHDHRSTMWPIQRDHIYQAHFKAIREAKMLPSYQPSEEYYINGPNGFSR